MMTELAKWALKGLYVLSDQIHNHYPNGEATAAQEAIRQLRDKITELPPPIAKVELQGHDRLFDRIKLQTIKKD
jgi:hypothetical protein